MLFRRRKLITVALLLGVLWLAVSAYFSYGSGSSHRTSFRGGGDSANSRPIRAEDEYNAALRDQLRKQKFRDKIANEADDYDDDDDDDDEQKEIKPPASKKMSEKNFFANNLPVGHHHDDEARRQGHAGVDSHLIGQQNVNEVRLKGHETHQLANVPQGMEDSHALIAKIRSNVPLGQVQLGGQGQIHVFTQRLDREGGLGLVGGVQAEHQRSQPVLVAKKGLGESKGNEREDEYSDAEEIDDDGRIVARKAEPVRKQFLPVVDKNPSVEHKVVNELGQGDVGARVDAGGMAGVASGNTGGGGEDAEFVKYAHNERASRRISLHRALPDVRDKACPEMKYADELPAASVVIVFYNEAWTTLLRTVHSVLNRSPPYLIKEIILVDDFSEHEDQLVALGSISCLVCAEDLKQGLTDYVALLPKVRLIRADKRYGVARSRQLGATAASAPVLIFLDSHCECTPGWLEPLLSRVAESRTNVVTPVMDIINDDTFAYKPFDIKSINIGGFDWNLQFTWISVPAREQKRRMSDIEPVRTPTMSGGMFAIDRQRFNELGGFDVEMNQWGGENLEMSFKTWMCGGTLETVPCSHVGHLFRKRTTYKMNDGGNPRKNLQRLAEVWLDDFKDQYYLNTGATPASYGDVSERKRLRERLKCQTFDWYLKNVYPELFVPTEALASGTIKNAERGVGVDGSKFTACIDSIVGSNAFEKPISIWPCHNQGGNQVWMLSEIGEIRREESCLDYSGSSVVIYPCHGQKGNQQWDYRSDGSIRHLGTLLCLGLTPDNSALSMSKCVPGLTRQTWLWRRHGVNSSGGAAGGQGGASGLQEVARDY